MPTEEAQREYTFGISGVNFIYNDDIAKYLHENVWCPAIDLETNIAILKGNPSEEERGELIQKNASIKKQLYAEIGEVNKKFKPFIQITH